MENLGQDYVRTAFAKGLHERRVIFVHALRNSLIPLVTGLGHVISLILAGSFLIERVFNIDGMGYLGYTAILQRDYPVALGILVIEQPADARRQHPVRHHLRGGRSAHPVQMSDRAPIVPIERDVRRRRRAATRPPAAAGVDLRRRFGSSGGSSAATTRFCSSPSRTRSRSSCRSSPTTPRSS